MIGIWSFVGGYTLKRKSLKFVAFGIAVLAVAGVIFWNFGGVQKKVVDYWDQQSSEYTAFTKELTAGTILEKTVVVDSISEDKYAYQCLDKEGRQVYDEILNAILNHTEKITVATLDPDVLKLAFEDVSSDYGGLFWIEGYSYTEYTRNDNLVSLEFAPKYTMSLKEQKQMQKKIDAAVEEFLSGISPTDSDYNKAKYVFEKLIEQVDYEKNAENSQNIISVFIDHKTVCQGYASATQYLLSQLNIPSVIVTGSANDEAHAWNLIQLDGNYYYMDTTWGNSTYLNEEKEESKFVNYSYFTFTTDEMLATHAPDDHIDLPECSSIADNYFVYEGFYFSDWAVDEIGDLYGQAATNESHRVAVKFADQDLYDRAKKYFIEQKMLENYCDISGNVYYLEDTDQLILTISIK